MFIALHVQKKLRFWLFLVIYLESSPPSQVIAMEPWVGMDILGNKTLSLKARTDQKQKTIETSAANSGAKGKEATDPGKEPAVKSTLATKVCIYCAGQGSCSPVQELVLCLL